MAKMLILLPLLVALCAEPAHSIFDGTCPRKEPPPGLLVLSPGSKLLLTCSGHVKVDGVKVSVARNLSNSSRKWISSNATRTAVNITDITVASVKSYKQTVKSAASQGYHSSPTEAHDNRIITHTDAGYTASPTTHMVRKSGVSRLLKSEYNWEAEEVGDEGELEEEEGEEGSRVTRGVKMMHHWKWNGKTVGKGDRDWGEIAFEERGATLSLSSVRVKDSGKYACYYKGREMFSVRVTIADPPETPSLSCYKRSPSSKIRCEWTPRKAFTITPDCFLLLSKRRGRGSEPFHQFKCSYSLRLSRCWCALDYNEDELRTLHKAYLCVTSIAGNATSNLQHFRPLGILKPEPPSQVSAWQEVGQETRLKVTWSYPKSWKSQDSFYELIYEIKYRPRRASFDNEQVKVIKEDRYYTITDVMPGVEYLIQLRASEEYDGQWSDWSTPVNASSWTAPSLSPLITTTFPVYLEGSGADDDLIYVIEPVFSGPELTHHILWISCLFILLSVTLAIYIFRYKDRFVSKLQSLGASAQCGDPPQPQIFTPTAPERQAVVIFAPPRYKHPPPNDMEEEEEEEEEEGEEEEGEEEEEDEQEQWINDRLEAQHFNNTTYFFVQKEG
ncbi:interleukin-6 receptor subunit alpha [Notolabrus celidotus]|uniref:interleukin-6 receptor subunit alpha n=1 Tax=Notolabrus celidotus TaxID=1203425 RepID=UPI0014906EA7|nr:interleukin-6 receptor subunit alpha [Notolabrus celidotus]